MILQSMGYDDVEPSSVARMGEEELAEMVTVKLRETQQVVVETRQEVVPLPEVAVKLGQGWKFVANLGDGMAVVEGT